MNYEKILFPVKVADIFILLIFLILLFVIIYLQFKLVRHKLTNCDTIQKDKIKFSVIIAAKNEQTNLPNLLNSLDSLNYPKELFEIIIVDDNSEDRTAGIVENFSGKFITPILLTKDKNAYQGKRGALQTGIAFSHFEHIVITDADCRVLPEWLNQLNNSFHTDADFIIGVSPLIQTGTFINSVASYENFRSYILSFSFARAGLPYSGIARNFAFKKEKFYQLSGFANTLQTVGGDDDLLIREAAKNGMKVDTMIHPSSFVYSSSPLSFNDYMTQKARHTATAGYYLTSHKILLAIWHCFNIFGQYSYIYFFLLPLLPVMYPVKLIADIMIGLCFAGHYGYRFTLFQLITLPFIYEWLLMHHYFNSRKRNIAWK